MSEYIIIGESNRNLPCVLVWFEGKEQLFDLVIHDRKMDATQKAINLVKNGRAYKSREIKYSLNENYKATDLDLQLRLI